MKSDGELRLLRHPFTQRRVYRSLLFLLWFGVAVLSPTLTEAQIDESSADWQAMRAAEQARVDAIQRVIGSVVAIYGLDRQGGGSGVVIDSSGLALTNHHVIQAAGTEGWGGLADGKLYRWSVIGTDPGGDLALIRLQGRDDFPFSRLGDSDAVRVGDWAMAMGNPFVLSEDETPTVTLGIVSGVNRFQEGAGSNQLVYGNCIQVDSSINPGNSGGPLFNLAGEVIGINGRGSFDVRGRVNVGLGYAISANQIKQFIPDLLATKLVQHGTPDATFDLRDGKIVCNSIEQDCEARKLGLELEDELLALEGIPIRTVNQYLNLLCTLPEGWPARLNIRKPGGLEQTLIVRLYGLPYNIPQPPAQATPDNPTPEQKQALERQQAMIRLLTTPPGAIRDEPLNRQSLEWLWQKWRNSRPEPPAGVAWQIDDSLERNGQACGKQRVILDAAGRFRVDWSEADRPATFGFDGNQFWKSVGDETKILSTVEAKLTPQIIQAAGIASQWPHGPLDAFGAAMLDGGDKARNQLSCRVKIVDPNQDWLFVWLSLFDDDTNWHVQPLKIGADLDSSGSALAVGMDDWRLVEGLHLPFQRTWLKGRDETIELTVATQSVTSLPTLDPTLFAPPANSDSSPPSAERRP